MAVKQKSDREFLGDASRLNRARREKHLDDEGKLRDCAFFEEVFSS